MRQSQLTRWFRDERPRRESARRPPPAPQRAVAAFADGAALGPWVARGFLPVVQVQVQGASARARASASADEAQHTGAAVAALLAAHAGDVAIALAFPACTDLSAAGARWWRAKRKRNPDFQREAVARIQGVEAALRASGAPFAMLVPAAPLLKRLWRDPSAVISPHEYGGWLAADAAHPLHADVVPKRDAYVKRTYVYAGNGFVLPRRKPVPPVWATRTTKRGATRRVSPLLVKRRHRHLRRLAPLGFLEAVASLHAERR